MKYVSVQDLVEQNQVVIKTGPFGTQLKASEYVSFGTPVLNVRNLGFATVNTDKLEMVSDGTLERLSAHKLVTGDIVFGRKGAVERHAFISESENGWMQGSDCIRLRVLADSVNPRFLSYYFLTKQHRAFMMSMCSHGTTMASLNQKIIEKIIVPLPERSIQDKVVEILAALDKQIATNQKINENLQQQAETLFNYWFTQYNFPDCEGRPYKSAGGTMVWNNELNDNIPDNWAIGNLYDIAGFINGLACQKYRPKASEKSMPVVKIREMHDGITKDTELVSTTIPKKNVLANGDILFSWSATLEVMYWYGGKAGLNQHIFKVVPLNGFPKEYVYHQLSAYVYKFVKMAEARKTTMGHITADHIQQSCIAIPPVELLKDFSEALNPIHQKMGQCQIENRKLTMLRNWLLPMLMNGQATIED